MLEDFRLKVFLTVSKHGSFTKAAAELKISQPAVSQHISELERVTGVKLFDRLHGEVRLTQQGSVFQIHAKRILDAYAEASALFSPYEPASVRVKASDEVYLYIYKALELFSQIHPEVHFHRSDVPDTELAFSLLPASEQKCVTSHISHASSHVPNEISTLRLCVIPSDSFSQTDLCRNLVKYFSDII